MRKDRVSPLKRAVIYSVVGFCFEVVFSAVHDAARSKPIRFRTSPWMFPIYALILPLYEPLHDRSRGRSAVVRGAVYGSGTLMVEYGTGALLRRGTGEAPWDYSYAKRHVHGLIRPEYFFLWASAGLALERLHDVLTEEGRSGGL